MKAAVWRMRFYTRPAFNPAIHRIALGTGCGRTHGEDGSGKTLITLVIRVFRAAIGLDGYAVLGEAAGVVVIKESLRLSVYKQSGRSKERPLLFTGNYLAR
jgi:hypothetical protein